MERLRVEEGQSPGPGAPDGVEGFMLPLVETCSSFMPGKYQSTLLPAENKPLEMSVLKRVKELLAEVDPKTAAKHITMADCMVKHTNAYTDTLAYTLKCICLFFIYIFTIE